MPYVDLQTIHNPATGNVAPASWGDQSRDNQEWFAEPPSCRVYHSTTQNLSASTFTALNANSELWDSASMHSTSSNTSRITIGTTGKYLFAATVEFEVNATNTRYARWLVSGSTTYPFGAVPAMTGVGVRLSGTTVLSLTAGAYVEVQAWQNSGGTITGQLLEFSALWVSR